MATNRQLQGRVDDLLATRAGADEEEKPFSHFRRSDVSDAAALASRLGDAAASDGVAAALATAEEALSVERTGVVKQAVKLFVAHDPRAQEELAFPTVAASPVEEHTDEVLEGATPAQDVLPVPNPETFPPEERRLDWYRQDPLANDHHHHWHFVYPTSETRDRPAQKRQGELFFYMHQQMLARYDTERLIAGLPRLVSFEPEPTSDGGESYSAAIPEGYGLPGYIARPGGTRLDDGGARYLGLQHRVLADALASRELDANLDGRGDFALTESLLGSAVEPSTVVLDEGRFELPQQYGFHGVGHMVVAGVVPRESTDLYQYSVMAYVETAICDPFFYRWHGHIDDISAEFQERAGANRFGDYAADVRFRGNDDIALVLSRDIDGADAEGFDFTQWGRTTFGDDPASFGAPATDQLLTRFEKSLVSFYESGEREEQPQPIETRLRDAELLNHEPFTVFLRIENLRDTAQVVTVRLFLAHEELVGVRRRWIELDKFKAALTPGVNVVAQPDARSSVIKRRDVKAPGAERVVAEPGDAWCDCGWPYSLLLPSGASTAEGTRFKLMAAVTSWELDTVDQPSSCGSMSFCGAKREYPDERNMGYPFDRPFPNDDPLSTFEQFDSMTVRDLTIRCETPHPGQG